MIKLDNYNYLNNKETKYFMYIIESLSKIESDLESTLNSRDFKISEILGYLPNFRNEVKSRISRIKYKINQIPFYEMDKSSLDNISNEINDTLEYIEFFKKDS